jgi:hypothetical protein
MNTSADLELAIHDLEQALEKKSNSQVAKV